MNATQIDATFRTRYRKIERQMRVLAEADGDIFLPNPEPEGPADYIFIGMEPSLGRWTRSADEAKSKVDAGFRNFLFSIEDFILHFCIRRYLCEHPQRYHMTDLSKGAMLIERTTKARVQRYDRWYALLQEEIDLVAKPHARVIAVGTAVARHLKRRGFPKPVARIIHYSGLAGGARSAGIVGHEASFAAFRDSVTLDDVLATAERVLKSAGMPAQFRRQTLSRLGNSRLTNSRKQLVFSYKVAFEALRS